MSEQYTVTLSRKGDVDVLHLYFQNATVAVNYIPVDRADCRDSEGMPLLRLEDRDHRALWLTGLSRVGTVGGVREVRASLYWILGTGFLLNPHGPLQWQCSRRDAGLYRRLAGRMFPKCWFRVLRGSLRSGNPYPPLVGETADEHIVEIWGPV